MKKNRVNFLMVGTVLAYITGIVCILVPTLDTVLQISAPFRNLLGVVGIGFILLGILLTALGARWMTEQDEEARREEQDERNCMIRGKAAENAMVFTTIVLLVTECAFMVMGSRTESFILAWVMLLCVFVQMGWIVYYQKKY